jgi:hypothetical protein
MQRVRSFAAKFRTHVQQRLCKKNQGCANHLRLDTSATPWAAGCSTSALKAKSLARSGSGHAPNRADK